MFSLLHTKLTQVLIFKMYLYIYIFASKFLPFFMASQPYPPLTYTPAEIRFWWGLINHGFPLIRPAIKPLFLGRWWGVYVRGWALFIIFCCIFTVHTFVSQPQVDQAMDRHHGVTPICFPVTCHVWSPLSWSWMTRTGAILLAIMDVLTVEPQAGTIVFLFLRGGRGYIQEPIPLKLATIHLETGL